MRRLRPSNDVQLKFFAFVAAAALATSQSDRDLADPKLWALALAAGGAAIVALLRPPGTPAMPQPEPPLTKDERKDAIREFIQEHAKPTKQESGRG